MLVCNPSLTDGQWSTQDGGTCPRVDGAVGVTCTRVDQSPASRRATPHFGCGWERRRVAKDGRVASPTTVWPPPYRRLGGEQNANAAEHSVQSFLVVPRLQPVLLLPRTCVCRHRAPAVREGRRRGAARVPATGGTGGRSCCGRRSRKAALLQAGCPAGRPTPGGERP